MLFEVSPQSISCSSHQSTAPAESKWGRRWSGREDGGARKERGIKQWKGGDETRQMEWRRGEERRKAEKRCGAILILGSMIHPLYVKVAQKHKVILSNTPIGDEAEVRPSACI